MSRMKRLEEYSRPLRPQNWQGPGRDASNIARWVERASENSDGHRRRASKTMKLPDRDDVALRATDARPYNARHVNARMVAKADLNHVGGSYLSRVRRGEF